MGNVGDEVAFEFGWDQFGHAVQIGRVDLEVLGSGDRQYGNLHRGQVGGGVVGEELPHPLGVDLLHRLDADGVAGRGLDPGDLFALLLEWDDVQGGNQPLGEAGDRLGDPVALPQQDLLARLADPASSTAPATGAWPAASRVARSAPSLWPSTKTR